MSGPICQKGMEFKLKPIPVTDVTRAIQQRTVRARMQRKAQTPIYFRISIPLHNIPASIQLIVRIDREFVFEVGKQGLAAGFDFTHLGTLKITLPALQAVQTKMDIDNLPAFKNSGDFVGSALISGPSGMGGWSHEQTDYLGRLGVTQQRANRSIRSGNFPSFSGNYVRQFPR